MTDKQLAKKVDKHATVRVGGYKIPLIGIDRDASQQECEACHESFHLLEVGLCDGKFLCITCR